MLESLHGVAATLCWIQKRAVPSCFTEKSWFCDQQRERTQNLFNAFLFGFALGVPASLEISNPWVSPLYTGKLATGHAEHPFIDPTLWKKRQWNTDNAETALWTKCVLLNFLVSAFNSGSSVKVPWKGSQYARWREGTCSMCHLAQHVLLGQVCRFAFWSRFE